MKQLFKVSTNVECKQVVSARDLHSFLENQDNVNTWFKSQVERPMLDEVVWLCLLSKF